MKFLQRAKEFFKRNGEQPANDAQLGLYDLRPRDLPQAPPAHQAAQLNAASTVGRANEYDKLPDFANKYDKLPDHILADRSNEERYVGSKFLKNANDAMRQEALRDQARPPEKYVGSQFLKDANEAMRPPEAVPQRDRRGTFGQELKPEIQPEKLEPVKPEPTVQRRGTFGQLGDRLKPNQSESHPSILEENREQSRLTIQTRQEHQLGASKRTNLTRSGHMNL